jgi:hypothetical protein
VESNIGRLLALLKNIRLVCKQMAVVNTPTFYNTAAITTVKSFKIQAPGTELRLPGFEPLTSCSVVECSNHCATILTLQRNDYFFNFVLYCHTLPVIVSDLQPSSFKTGNSH